jgi:hypothetical protein
MRPTTHALILALAILLLPNASAASTDDNGTLESNGVDIDSEQDGCGVDEVTPKGIDAYSGENGLFVSLQAPALPGAATTRLDETGVAFIVDAYCLVTSHAGIVCGIVEGEVGPDSIWIEDCNDTIKLFVGNVMQIPDDLCHTLDVKPIGPIYPSTCGVSGEIDWLEGQVADLQGTAEDALDQPVPVVFEKQCVRLTAGPTGGEAPCDILARPPSYQLNIPPL